MSEPCRYSTKCRRPDCYFLHPAGRDLDGTSGVSPPSSPHRSGGGGGGGANACRYSTKCRRADCYFSHPAGREIDGTAQPTMGGRGSLPLHPSRTPSPGGQTDEQMRAYMEQIMMHEDEQARRDQWFPDARTCGCCKGFIYGCSDSTCVALGMCGCMAGQVDDTMSQLASQQYSPPPQHDQQQPPQHITQAEGQQLHYEPAQPPVIRSSDDPAVVDQWFPDCRDCSCCKGYIYGCDCKDLGMCICSVGGDKE